MKTIFNILLLVAFAAPVFWACEDDDSTTEQPVIEHIRSTSAAVSDSLLVSGSMGQTIAIMGEDMQDVVEVLFNDQKAKLNPVYVTGSSIIVTIPGTIPDEVTNTITLKTSTGKTTVYDFTVVITPPLVESISCEWATAGSTITLYGDYFFPKKDGSIKVLFPGNLEAKVSEITKTSVTAEVPAGALSGYVTVSNDYGTGRSKFVFRDKTGIFINGENPSVWNLWGLSDFASAGGIDGQYLKFEGKTGSWAWPANALHLFYINPAAGPLVTQGKVTDYALKFEYYCHEWHDTPLMIWFSNEYNTHDGDGADAQYHWKPYMKGGKPENFKTDGWNTLTIPLEDFKYNKTGSETTRVIPGFEKLQNLNMMWFGAVDKSTTEFGLKIWIDNIRLVKIK